MKTLILIPLFGAVSAYGAIGDSLREIELRYGDPQSNSAKEYSVMKNGLQVQVNEYSFLKEGIPVRVKFVDSYSVEERFTADREFSKSFVAGILHENASTFVWNVSGSGPWLKARRSDNGVAVECRVINRKAPADSPDLVTSTYELVVWKL